VGNKRLLQRSIWLAVVACVALLVTSYIRHQLIEPVTMGVYCATSSNWECSVRQLAITALQERRFAWAAFALVGIAYVSRFFPIALLAWSVASAGLVLYTAELCSIALLLAGLVAIRGANVAIETGNARQSQ
jgi:hypothetical protein